ncbi:hypothetical protein A6A03_04560 [Chloroflexus islandicus]|uniref:Uncharacterized protein n=1 Tax=Chloroflexus islandicus TaxID=1707952 RepID=A0A178LZW3_9CHLR|nr:hypothetical protein [Chloroflexus islandicus]OAN40583.1 hypothetical protein A6A03_04560 [Chloroflexus islandicus]
MASPEILRTIEELADARDARAALAAAYDAKKADIMRQVADELAALDAEYTPLLAASDAQIKTLEQDIRAAVLQHGASVRGSRMQAVYIRGRTTWDTKGLLRYAAHHPDVLVYRKEPAPTVQLRMIKEEPAPAELVVS